MAGQKDRPSYRARCMEDYYGVLLRFSEWCAVREKSTTEEMRKMLLERMGEPITVPPPSPGPRKKR